MTMCTRWNGRFLVSMNTGTMSTPERMAIMAAPPLTSACPGFFTRVPSGKISRFQPCFRLWMAVFTAWMSELPRSTANTPMALRMLPRMGIRSSCFLAMIRRG